MSTEIKATLHTTFKCERCFGLTPTSLNFTVEIDVQDLTAYKNDTTNFYGLGAKRLQRTLKLCYPDYEEGVLGDIVITRPRGYEDFFDIVKRLA